MKLKIRMPICCDEPNKNGTIYSKEAIKNFLNNLDNIPVKYDKELIGYTDILSAIEYKGENNISGITFNVDLLGHIKPEIIIKEMEDDKITNFQIKSISIVK